MLLELRNVTARYGSVEAVRGLSLQVDEGAAVALIGRNGAGKTTTLRVASSILRPSRGEVYLDGDRVDGLSPGDLARRGLAQVPEGRGVFGGLTVLENLAAGAYWRRLKKAQALAEAERVLELLPALKPHVRQAAGSLSGGQQQMLAIARALVSRPRLLMIDEPSLGLSPIMTEELYERLSVLHREERMALLLVEQYVDLALDMTSYAYVLEKGEVVLQGPARELHDHPEVLSAYVG